MSLASLFGSGLVMVTWLTKYSTLAAGGIALKMNLDAETVLFAILDIFTQGILGYWILIAHDSAAGT